MDGRVILQLTAPRDTAELERGIRRALEIGFAGVELPVRAASVASGEGIDAFAESLRNRSELLGSVARAFTYRCTCLNLEAACEDITTLMQRMRPCAPGWLSLAVPPLATTGAPRGFRGYQDALNFTYKLLREIRWEVESSGLVVGIEAACGGCLLSPVELRELLDSVNCWAIGATVDAGRVAGFSDPLDWLSTLGTKVRVFRVTTDESLDTLADARAALGRFAGPWIAALERSQYDGLLVLRPTQATMEALSAARTDWPDPAGLKPYNAHADSQASCTEWRTRD